MTSGTQFSADVFAAPLLLPLRSYPYPLLRLGNDAFLADADDFFFVWPKTGHCIMNQKKKKKKKKKNRK